MPTTGRRATTRPWLLPQERWVHRLLERVLARRAAEPPNPQRLAFQQNYGPKGEVFLQAVMADALFGVILIVGGIFLDILSGDKGIPAKTGNWLTAVGILLALIGMVRAIQSARAGKAFRAGRPPVRPGQRLL